MQRAKQKEGAEFPSDLCSQFAWPLQGYKVLARPLWVTAVFSALEFYSWSSTRGSEAGLWALPTSSPAFQHAAFWGGTGQRREVESGTRELLLRCAPCRELQLQHTWHRPLLLIILSFKMRGEGWVNEIRSIKFKLFNVLIFLKGTSIRLLSSSISVNN